MKKLIALVTLVILVTSPQVRAGTLASVGTLVVFEKDNDGRSQVMHQPFQFRGGYRHSLADIFLEYSAFSVSEGNEMILVSRTHTEISMWARKSFFRQWILAANVGAGAGFQYDRIQTRFADTLTTDQGSPYGLLAASLGLEAKIISEFSVLLESRLATGTATSSAPTYGVGLLAQFIF